MQANRLTKAEDDQSFGVNDQNYAENCCESKQGVVELVEKSTKCVLTNKVGGAHLIFVRLSVAAGV